MNRKANDTLEQKEIKLSRHEAAHILDVCFSVPIAVLPGGEERVYHNSEMAEAKKMAIQALKGDN